MNCAQDHAAMNITATYFKLLELSKVLTDDALVRAMAEQSNIPEEQVPALFEAMKRTRGKLRDELQSRVENYHLLTRSVPGE